MSASASTSAEMGGGQDAAPGQAFAQHCANAKLPEIQARLEECRRIESGVLTTLRIVDQTTAASDEAWNAALPGLEKEQKLRSRRGKWQNLEEQAGLETFEDWWERICVENGFKIPLRTVQDRLKKHRDRIRQEPRPKVQRGPSLTRQQQKRIVLAGILGQDLADTAFKTGDQELKAVARAFQEAAPSRDEMEQILDRFSDVEPAAVGERTSIPMEEGKATLEQRAIKRGNVSDLSAGIEESNGARMTICFDGLDGHGVAHAAEMIANGILQRHGHVARGDGEYQVSITYTPAKLHFHRRWKPKESVN